MNPDAPHNITELLVAWGAGDEGSLERLTPLVYDELRRLASRHLARERAESLQPTALVHEAYLRLIDQRSVTWQNRAHFFAIAARLMRRILIDHARRRVAERRGGGAVHVALDEAGHVSLERSGELLALDEALDELATVDARKSQVVELRFFGGLSVQETAETLGVSEITVMRDWSTARAWLHRSITGSARSSDP
jgi:RNA polymerase sigma-70 factor (ECF subfamily)